MADDLSEYVELGNYPGKGKEENKVYERDFIQQRIGGPLRYLNVSMQRMKDIAIAMLDDDEALWFGCDVGKDSFVSRDGDGTGHLVYNLLDRDSLFNIDTKQTKVERMETEESNTTHAMVLAGYDRTDEGLKFKVENSWGEKAGIRGYLVMDEAWFDNYAFEIISKKKYLNKEELQALNKEAIKLMPWES